MRVFRLARFFAVVVACVAFSLVVRAQELARLPAPVAEVATADTRGMCINLNCGEGGLAAELARKTQCFVFALTTDEAACEKARRALDRAGFFGIRATAVVGTSKTLPFPDGYGNLIVTDDYREDIDLKEVRRVLNPHGVAVVGVDRADGAKLKAALDEAGIRNYTLTGNFAVFRGRMPAGVDEWTHWPRAPDSHPVSIDGRVKPPFLTQWIGSPGSAVVSGAAVVRGRYALKFAEVGDKEPGETLEVRDSFNGRLLWRLRTRTKTPGWCLAMVGDVLYLIDGGSEVLAYDAASGKQLRTYQAPEGSEAAGAALVKLMVWEGRLYLMARKTDLGKDFLSTHWGDTFFALNLDDGHLLWTCRCEKPVQASSVVLGDGALYSYAPNWGLVALELADGKERWRNAGAAARLGQGEVGFHALNPTRTWASYYDGRLYCFKPELVCVDSKTGKTLWEAKDRRQPLIIGDKAYLTGQWSSSAAVLEVAEGKETGEFPFSTHCGYGTGTASTLFCYEGALSLPDRKMYVFGAFRGPCVGEFAADGLAFWPPWLIHDTTWTLSGSIALAPRGERKAPDGTADLGSRIEKGPAFAAPPTKDAAPDDWPCYRHDPAHSGSTVAAVKTPLALAWEQKLTGELTAPSVGGGLVYVASGAGEVWGLNPGDGAVRWKFLCGRGVPVTPTYWRGRLLVGSKDGWVYCLEAGTGRLAWKFRAAPEERYISVLDEVISTWPVLTGVVVEDGVACFAAGICSYDQPCMYALDAASGKVLWTKTISDLDDFGRGINPQGAMALSGDLLYLPQGGNKPAAFNRKDGSLVWWPLRKGAVKETTCLSWFKLGGGTELTAEGDAFVVGSSRWLIGGTGRRCPYILCDTATGNPYGVEAAAKEGKLVLDKKGLATEYFLAGPSYSEIAARCTPILTKDFVLVAGYGVVKALDRGKLAPMNVVGAEEQARMGKEVVRWSAKTGVSEPHTLVVAGPQVVVAGAKAVRGSKEKEGGVAVIDQADGKEVSYTKVPAALRPNGLAVAGGKVFLVTEDARVMCLRQ